MREPRRIELRPSRAGARTVRADLCVVGAGAAGVSAAVHARRLGLSVCLVDGLPQIGGQSVNGLIGTLCGFFSSGEPSYQLTYGFADDVLAELAAAGALSYRRGRGTVIALYDEHELAGIYARHLVAQGVQVVLGAILIEARRDGDAIAGLALGTRYGPLEVTAHSFVDASGDGALASSAGVGVKEAEAPVYGTSMFSVVGIARPVPSRSAVISRLEQVADRYGLDRRDGFVFEFPGRDLCLVNLTHFETPLDALEMSRVTLEARGAIDKVLAFLRTEFPESFGHARIGSVGLPGVRQTRGVAALAPLMTEDVRAGRRPADAIARCAWPIEFHGSAEGVHWEEFPPGHITWVPLSAMIARDVKNLIAAGRAIDAEPFALSAVRVIGPCMAMGAAAAAAAAVSPRNLHAADAADVQRLVSDNLERRDPAPLP